MINLGWFDPSVKEQPENQLLWKRLNGLEGVRIMPPMGEPEQSILVDKAQGSDIYEKFQNWF